MSLQAKFSNWDSFHSKGGAVVALTYADGVVIGFDVKSDAENTKPKLESFDDVKSHKRIEQLADNVYICVSGSGIYSYFEYFRNTLQNISMNFGEPVTVTAATNLFQTMCVTYSGSETSSEPFSIMGGWDSYKGAQLYNISRGELSLLRHAVLGFCSSDLSLTDDAWIDGLTKDEAEISVVKAVSVLTAQDAASGDVIHTININSEGVSRSIYPSGGGNKKANAWRNILSKSNANCRGGDVIDLSNRYWISPSLYEYKRRRGHKFEKEVSAREDKVGLRNMLNSFSSVQLCRVDQDAKAKKQKK